MKYFLSIAIAALLLSFVIKEKESGVKIFSWLEGSWTMKTKRGAIIESWKTGNENLMQGNSKMVNASGDEKIMENLELIYAEGNYYYISAVNGQNNGQSIKFKLSSYNEKGFVAENPEHDFPKRIAYNLINKDSIHAFIDGGPSMPDKKSDFYYSRVKE